MNAPLPRRPFGGTGAMVSALALGGHEYLSDGRSRGFNEDIRLAVTPGWIGEGYGGTRRREVLAAAYDLGINLFDVTIDSEKEALGRNLRETPPPYDIHVVTRPEGFCYSYDEGNLRFLDLAALRAEVHRVLRLLRRERIEFLNVGLLAWSIDRTPGYLDVLAGNLMRLRQEGLIGHALADSFSGERLYLAQLASGAFAGVNLDLNVGDAEGLARVVPEARRRGLGVLAREAFLKGTLFGIGASAGLADPAALARAALRWTVREGRPDSVIVGVDDAAQLHANAAAVLDSEDRGREDAALLDRLRAIDAFRAYEAGKLAEFRGA